MSIDFKLILLCLGMTVHTLSSAGIRHERVIWHESPTHEAMIAWTSDNLDSNSTIYFDIVSHKGVLDQYQFQAKPSRQGKFSRGIFHRGPFYNHAKLQGLDSGSSYYFVIVSDGAKSQEHYFRTAPKGGEEFKLIFGGDSRSDYEQRLKMNKVMSQFIDAQDQILALVHGGDYVFNGNSWPDWERWLNDHALTTGSDGRLLPIIPTRGNHEYSAQLFNEIWGWPNDGKGYFSSDFDSLEIITLNTEVSVHGDQKDWLRSQLEIKRPVKKWVVANYHRPAYPAVKRPSSAKAAWVPLFETFQVDMVFESDGHVYKQTAPIYQDRVDHEKGIIYVGEGGLGVKQREPNEGLWFLQDGGLSLKAHHFQLVTVGQDFTYEAIDENGRSFSTIQLPSKNHRLTSSQ